MVGPATSAHAREHVPQRRYPCVLCSLQIDPAQRRQGAGRLLVAFACTFPDQPAEAPVGWLQVQLPIDQFVTPVKACTA